MSASIDTGIGGLRGLEVAMSPAPAGPEHQGLVASQGAIVIVLAIGGIALAAVVVELVGVVLELPWLGLRGQR